MARMYWIHCGDATHHPMSTHRGDLAEVRRVKRDCKRENWPVTCTPIKPTDL